MRFLMMLLICGTLYGVDFHYNVKTEKIENSTILEMKKWGEAHQFKPSIIFTSDSRSPLRDPVLLRKKIKKSCYVDLMIFRTARFSGKIKVAFSDEGCSKEQKVIQTLIADFQKQFPEKK